MNGMDNPTSWSFLDEDAGSAGVPQNEGRDCDEAQVHYDVLHVAGLRLNLVEGSISGKF